MRPKFVFVNAFTQPSVIMVSGAQRRGRMKNALWKTRCEAVASGHTELAEAAHKERAKIQIEPNRRKRANEKAKKHLSKMHKALRTSLAKPRPSSSVAASPRKLAAKKKESLGVVARCDRKTSAGPEFFQSPKKPTKDTEGGFKFKSPMIVPKRLAALGFSSPPPAPKAPLLISTSKTHACGIKPSSSLPPFPRRSMPPMPPSLRDWTRRAPTTHEDV